MRHLLIPALLAPIALSLANQGEQAHAQAQAVRGVLFFSPTCPHCEQVMTQDLPVFFRIYGGRPRLRIDSTVPERERALFLLSNGQLEILMVDASRPAGAALYQASMASHPVEPAREGVPRLIVGDSVLVGSLEIPARLHRLIREAQAGGGLDWPAITGLEEAMAGLPPTVLATADAAGQPGVADAGGAARQPATAEGETPQVQPPGGSAADAAPQPAPTPATAEAPPRAPPALEDAALAQPAESATVTQTPFDVIAERRPSMLENLQRDPIGNGLSVVVLLGSRGFTRAAEPAFQRTGHDGSHLLRTGEWSQPGVTRQADN